MRIHKSYDAIIVGAGPAGSTAAHLLATAGLQVLILDKHRFPRPKLCGGLITWKTVQLLDEVFQSDVDTLNADGVIVHKSRGYAVCSPDHRCFRGNMDFPLHFVDRSRYDSLWLERARSAGAQYCSPADVICVDPKTHTVETRDGHRYQGRFIIGADGALSRVRAALASRGRLNQQTRPGLARAIEIKLPRTRAAALPDYPRIYYGHLPWGYAWSFPGPDYQLLGIAGLRRNASNSLLTAFRRFLAALSISVPAHVKPQAAALPYGNFLKSPGWGKILLVGDAGGLVDPLLGEGIYHAHRSGQLAAQSIIACTRSENDALALYRAALARRMIPDLRYARAGRNLVYALPPRWYYPVLTAFLKIIGKACEDTIQGKRSFLWFRPV